MESAQFTIPLLREDRQALDLGNALTAVKGVASIKSDIQGHTVLVVYDRDFTDPATLQHMIEDAGYPVEDGK